jgi:hypothetical protein
MNSQRAGNAELVQAARDVTGRPPDEGTATTVVERGYRLVTVG